MEVSRNIGNLTPIYNRILEKAQLPGYIICKHIPISFKKTESDKELWKKHDEALKNKKIKDIEPKTCLLDLKIELALRIFKKCHLCERKCLVDRNKQSGHCNVMQPQIASEFLHFGEERILIPSYTIFFSGCTFNCVFCQNWDISQQKCGLYIKPSILSELIKKREIEGAINANWVGGDPTPNIPFILDTLKNCNVNIAQIWNSNMYCSNESMCLLNGVIDLYLTDFKYGNNKCAKKFSKVDNYLKIVQRNHIYAYNNGDIIIRHLVMPNHIDCCSKPALKWIRKNLPNAIVNIMGQYHPEYHAHNFKDISQPVSIQEIKTVREYADKICVNYI